jgi:hypothetical protein
MPRKAVLIDSSRTQYGDGLTMISRRDSRFTLKGMFLMTIAVGIISSSGFWPGVEGMRWPMGGEPPEDEKSELLLGERGRFSGTAELSSHC